MAHWTSPVHPHRFNFQHFQFVTVSVLGPPPVLLWAQTFTTTGHILKLMQGLQLTLWRKLVRVLLVRVLKRQYFGWNGYPTRIWHKGFSSVIPDLVPKGSRPNQIHCNLELIHWSHWSKQLLQVVRIQNFSTQHCVEISESLENSANLWWLMINRVLTQSLPYPYSNLIKTNPTRSWYFWPELALVGMMIVHYWFESEMIQKYIIFIMCFHTTKLKANFDMITSSQQRYEVKTNKVKRLIIFVKSSLPSFPNSSTTPKSKS